MYLKNGKKHKIIKDKKRFYKIFYEDSKLEKRN